MLINGAAIASFVVPTGSMENTVMTGDFLFVNKFIYGPSTPQVIPFLNIELPFLKVPGPRNPQVNDVIVFIYPGNRDDLKSQEFLYYLKRCVATAGDTLQVIDKKVYVNGKELKLAQNGKYDWTKRDIPASFPVNNEWTMDNYGPLRIPKKGDKIRITKESIVQWETFIRREGHEVIVSSGHIYIDGSSVDYYTVEKNYCFGMGDNRDNSDDSRNWGFIPWENVVGTPIFVYWSWDTNSSFSNLGDKLSSINFGRIGKVIR